MAAKTLIETWIAKERRVLAAGKRRYPHFDPFLNVERHKDRLLSFLQNPAKVETHSFYPFFKSSILTPRYKKKKSEDGTGETNRAVEIKDRPVVFAAHFDSYIYSWYATLLNEKYKRKAEKWGIYDSVLAYVEKGQSNIHFALEACAFIKQQTNAVALAFDIESFFDHLDHAHLERMWGTVINVRGRLPRHHFKVFQSLTAYSYVEMAALESLFPTFFRKLERNRQIKDPKKRLRADRICTPEAFREGVRKKGLIQTNPFVNTLSGSSRHGERCGVPQGLPISAVLSNIYMIEFDIRMAKLVKRMGGKYYRYSDDLLIIVEQGKEAEIQVAVQREMAACHLTINAGKTEVVYFQIGEEKMVRGYDRDGRYQNLQYLGFEFSGQNFYIRPSSMARYHRRMAARIRENLKAGYGKSAIGEKVFKKKLLNRYTMKGKRNFTAYGHRAAEMLNSGTIHRQIRNSIPKVMKAFDERKKKFEERKGWHP